MVRHEHVGMHRAPMLQATLCEEQAIVSPIRVVDEDRSAIVAALHDVRGDIGDQDARTTGHVWGRREGELQSGESLCLRRALQRQANGVGASPKPVGRRRGNVYHNAA